MARVTTNVYDVGDDVELLGTFTDSDGDETDPTAVLLVVKKPNGAKVSYKSATGWSSQGAWNASTNSPMLANGTGTAGHYYTVSAAGIVDFGDGNISFAASDQVYYNGDIWQVIPSPSAATIDHNGTGVFRYEQHATREGDWFYNFEGIGDAQGAGEKRFIVRTRHAR